MRTDSECLFEQFCERNQLRCLRVATASDQGEPRPDYRVTGHDATIVFAEIKQVTPNGEERRQERLLLDGKVGSFSTTPGARMREYIAKANPQLRARTGGSAPGLLVVYNDHVFLRHHTDPYAVLTAMRGLDVVPVIVPKDPRLTSQFLDLEQGPGKRMTAQANTSISAILAMGPPAEQAWVVTVYHNHYAACPLPVSALVGESFAHRRMTEDEQGWESWPLNSRDDG